MFVIIGIKKVNVTLSQGEFFCRACNAHSPYRICEPREYVTLFFLPIWRCSEAEPFALCEVCGSRYHVDEVFQSEEDVRAKYKPWECADCGTPNEFTSAGCINCGRRRPDLEGL